MISVVRLLLILSEEVVVFGKLAVIDPIGIVDPDSDPVGVELIVSWNPSTCSCKYRPKSMIPIPKNMTPSLKEDWLILYVASKIDPMKMSEIQ